MERDSPSGAVCQTLHQQPLLRTPTNQNQDAEPLKFHLDMSKNKNYG